jgi:hypothetical protein
MKRTLEAVLLLAALALGAYVVRQGLERRALASHPPAMNPASMPGPDAEAPGAPVRPAGGVRGLPMVKLSRPAKPDRRAPAVPPPPAP